MIAREYNFDGIVGPTHHYGGLSLGNIPSQSHQGVVSCPRQAALQGLAKMKYLMNMGIPQGIIPPQERPNLTALANYMNLAGSDVQILEQAYKKSPKTFSAFCSSSSMWAANAATVTPSSDTRDKKTHFSIANLCTFLHRSLESEQTYMIFKKIFNGASYAVHTHFKNETVYKDEGAANHMRLCSQYGEAGLQLFIYGASSRQPQRANSRFPVRQTREASQAIIKKHKLASGRALLIRQNPVAIQSGVFHNDVIATSNQSVLMLHEKAFANQPKVLEVICQKFWALTKAEPLVLQVKEKDIPLAHCVSSYLFNSQLVTLSDNSMMMLAPMECKQSPIVHRYLQSIAGNKAVPISRINYIDLRESMQNGGGPACLRLRVVLNKEEASQVHKGCLLNAGNIALLEEWVARHYRDELTLKDLADPLFLWDMRTALDELTQILKLGSIYSFQ